MRFGRARKSKETPEEITRSARAFAGTLISKEWADIASQRLKVAGLGRLTLTGNREIDSSLLREEFHIQLIELADRFHDLDHEFGPTGGSELHSDCAAVTELTRKQMHPRFHEVFRDQQRDLLDADILRHLVSSPDT